MIALVLIGGALAAGPGDDGYVADEINAEPFRPALDPGSMLATEQPEVTERVVARADAWQARNLLIWTSAEDSADQRALVGDLTTVHLAAARGNGRWRLGAGVPLHLLTRSDEHTTPSFVSGDLMLSAKYRPLGGPIAVTAAYSVPLSGSSFQLGSNAASLDAGLVAGFQGERLGAAANAGARLQENVTIDNPDGAFDFGSQVWYRAGVSYGLRADWALTTELSGAFIAESVYGQPLELLVGGRREQAERGGRLLRVGLGVGLRAGIGAPTWRLLVGTGRDPGPLPQVEEVALPSF